MRAAIDGLRTRAKRQAVLECIGPSLLVYNEPRLLARFNESRLLGRTLNHIVSPLRLDHVRLFTRRLGFRAPILWIFDPMMAQAVGTFGEKLVVYYVLDNYVEFVDPAASALREAVARRDTHLLKRADLVVTVSERLQKRGLSFNPHTYLVPNGVNYEFFEASLLEGQIPPDMRNVKRPIVGYVGAIQPIVDFSLLRRMSEERPSWSLVLVGPMDLGTCERREFDALVSRPNVHYFGCKPVEDIPAFINSCDVCIMPYHPGRSTVPDSDSIKLYEYFACGRPVVSVDVPSARRFEPLLRIANDAAAFIRCVEESLTEDPDLSERRKFVASEHSWQRRAALLSDLIRSRLGLSSTSSVAGAGSARPVQESDAAQRAT